MVQAPGGSYREGVTVMDAARRVAGEATDGARSAGRHRPGRIRGARYRDLAAETGTFPNCPELSLKRRVPALHALSASLKGAFGVPR